MFELALALLAFCAFCALVEAVQKVLVARAKRPACPCQDLHSLTLTPGAVFELPPGMKISDPTEAAATVDWSGMTDRSFALSQVGMTREQADLRTIFSAEGAQAVSSAFEEARDARDIERARKKLASGKWYQHLEGEILMLKVNLRRERRGLPSVGFA